NGRHRRLLTRVFSKGNSKASSKASVHILTSHALSETSVFLLLPFQVLSYLSSLIVTNIFVEFNRYFFEQLFYLATINV
ncbi:TPA: hypothetical protein ACG89E_002838, partial [Enterococcus faecium]